MILSDAERKQMHDDWAQKHHTSLDIDGQADALMALFKSVSAADSLTATRLTRIIERHVHDHDHPVSRDKIIDAYQRMVARGLIPFEQNVLEKLRLSPMRTQSGVAPLAVLTGPFPCPGECIFCPEVAGFPKSYLPDEPGAQRAAIARFDPFKQTASRLRAFENVGHGTDKIELLILGATWSAYPHKYQESFIQRCLDALNGTESSSLEDAQRANETAKHRNVGLVIETRPDNITLDEVRRLRWLGVTKVQLGAQSFDDTILDLNKRGHNAASTRRAVRLLRLAGFKLHLHWMPNLLGATPESDRADFQLLWGDAALRPDEIKIYPCSLIKGTELYSHWERGEYRPYTDEELVQLLIDCKSTVPPYCRINRIIRDIPANYIAAGSTTSNLRVVVKREMKQLGLHCNCIRCREVKGDKLDTTTLQLGSMRYETDATTEHFLDYVTPNGRLAGFLRLSLPSPDVPRDEILEELHGCAVIREVHILGPALEIGAASHGEAQHAGLGTRLVERAVQIARDGGYRRIAVISAIGTREYYRKIGFELGELYMARSTIG